MILKQTVQISADVGCLRVPFTTGIVVRENELLRIRADCMRTLISLIPERLELEDGRVLGTISLFSKAIQREDREKAHRQRSVLIAKCSDELPPGTRLILVAQTKGTDAPVGAAVTGAIGFLLADQIWKFEVLSASSLSDSDDDWHPCGEPTVVHTMAGRPRSLEAYRKPDGRLVLRYLDASLNPAIPDCASVKAGNRSIALKQSTQATIVDLGDEPDRVDVIDDHGRRIAATPLPRGLDGTPIWFGEFHWHTNFSGDGSRDMSAALRSAKEESSFDVAGASDHNNWNLGFFGGTVDDQIRISAPFDEPGRFVALPTFELSGRVGHANVIADSWPMLRQIAEAIGKANPVKNRGTYPLLELASLIPPGRGILVPHHTNMDSYAREKANAPDGRPVWCAFDWGPTPERKAVRLAEIHQGRGSFEDEVPDEKWRIDCGGYGASIRMALAQGFRIGFTGGTDNHSGWPGRNSRGWCGMTGIFAASLDLPSVFRALYQRRVYATSGLRIVGDFALNGHAMGSEISLPLGEPRNFKILLRGTAPWESVQVISAGCVLAEIPVPPETLDLETDWSDDRPGRPTRNCYYYVRARQNDGHCVWLSPIWVDLLET